MICPFMLDKDFGALAANVVSGSTDGGFSSIAICSLHCCYGSNLYIPVLVFTGVPWWVSLRRWCGAFVFGPGQQSDMDVDLPPPPRQFPSVLEMGKMIAMDYTGEAGFFHQRLIHKTASAAALLITVMCAREKWCLQKTPLWCRPIAISISKIATPCCRPASNDSFF